MEVGRAAKNGIGLGALITCCGRKVDMPDYKYVHNKSESELLPSPVIGVAPGGQGGQWPLTFLALKVGVVMYLISQLARRCRSIDRLLYCLAIFGRKFPVIWYCMECKLKEKMEESSLRKSGLVSVHVQACGITINRPVNLSSPKTLWLGISDGYGHNKLLASHTHHSKLLLQH